MRGRWPASIDPASASRSAELGQDIVTGTVPPEPDETTHYSVIDRDGMAVATTTTLEGSYGAHVVVKGAGFLLNNEMGDFNPKPGETNRTGDIGTPANVIAPGKRMLSSMTPAMVVRDGKLVLVTGSPGGRTIINTVFQIVLGVVEYGLTGREAVDLARLHHQWLPDRVTIEKKRIVRPIPRSRSSRQWGMTSAHTLPREDTRETRIPSGSRRMAASSAFRRRGPRTARHPFPRV